MEWWQYLLMIITIMFMFPTLCTLLLGWFMVAHKIKRKP